MRELSLQEMALVAGGSGCGSRSRKSCRTRTSCQPKPPVCQPKPPVCQPAPPVDNGGGSAP
jgi:hypothetical protein